MTSADRKLSMSDLMILVAASALGFAAIRGVFPGISHILPTSPSVRFLIPRPLLEFLILLIAAWPLPAMLTIGLMLIRLRAPRPRWRELSRQPGFVAGFAVAVATSFNALFLLVLSLKVSFSADFFMITIIPVGFGVGLAWSTLLLSGRWRVYPNRFELVGRIAGCYWIAMLAVACLVFITILR